MTRELIYMHGMNNAIQYYDERFDISTPRKFDYLNLSDGQFLLQLLQEEIDIDRSYYGDPNGELERSSALIKDALIYGLHTKDVTSSKAVYLKSKNENYVYNVILSASKRNGIIGGGLARLGSFEQPQMSEQCQQAINDYNSARLKLSNGFPVPNWAEIQSAYTLCQKIYVQDLLNNNLNNTSHHFLYNYATPQIQNRHNIVAAKATLHKAGIDGLSEVSGISSITLSQWVRNGIKRGNQIGGIPPWSPEETIGVLDTGQRPSISGVAEDIVAIGEVLVKVLAVVAPLIGSLKQRDQAGILAQIPGIGGPTYNPSLDDWSNQIENQNTTGTGFDLNSIAIPAVLIAGAYLLSSPQKSN